MVFLQQIRKTQFLNLKKSSQSYPPRKPQGISSSTFQAFIMQVEAFFTPFELVIMNILPKHSI